MSTVSSAGTLPALRTNIPPGFAERRAGRTGPENGLERVRSVAGTLVQNDEVQVQAAVANVAVPLDKLVDERLVVSHRDTDQHDRPIAGDGMRPQARLAQTIGGDRFRRAQR